MYVETHKQFVARAARCERTGNQMKEDGAACIHSKAQWDFVCLGLLDVNAQAIR